MSKTFLRLVIPEAGTGTLPPPCTKEDAELFFPRSYEGAEYQHQIREAKAVCRKCPIDTRTNCLEFALDTGDKYGILGGTTPAERSAIQHRRTEQERRAA